MLPQFNMAALTRLVELAHESTVRGTLLTTHEQIVGDVRMFSDSALLEALLESGRLQDPSVALVGQIITDEAKRRSSLRGVACHRCGNTYSWDFPGGSPDAGVTCRNCGAEESQGRLTAIADATYPVGTRVQTTHKPSSPAANPGPGLPGTVIDVTAKEADVVHRFMLPSDPSEVIWRVMYIVRLEQGGDLYCGESGIVLANPTGGSN